jgi:hypothetical protein
MRRPGTAAWDALPWQLLLDNPVSPAGCNLVRALPALMALRDGAEVLVDIVGASTSAVVATVILATHPVVCSRCDRRPSLLRHQHQDHDVPSLRISSSTTTASDGGALDMGRCAYVARRVLDTMNRLAAATEDMRN